MNYRVGLSTEEISEEVLQRAGFTYSVVEPRKRFLESVKKVLGKPYKRGASVLNDAPETFDCSSLTAWAAVEAGYAIPRISVDQFVFSKRMEREQLEPGDLIFANTKQFNSVKGEYYSRILDRMVREEPIRYETVEYMPGTAVPHGIDHVGVFVGDGKVIHASFATGAVVEEEVETSEQFRNIVGHGRIILDETPRFVVEIPHERTELRSRDALLEELRRHAGELV
ncbi:NlpC/P60 family protein [Candidatus Wolfebacteria bacterium]|nr:NlpC/P60 family protein [Candidatus Wolfebacteria bacterium]